MLETIVIFHKHISIYAIFAMLGLLFAVIYCVWKVDKKLREDMVFMITYAAIGAFIGAKLLYIFVSLGEIMEYRNVIFASIENITTYFFSGYVFYGGLLGALLGCIIYCKQYHIELSQLLSIAIVAVPLFHFFGRLGCFFTGCCYGVASNSLFSCSYHTPFAQNPDASRIPIQLMEACCNLVLFFYLHHILSHHKQNTILQYLVIYSLLRFLLEFLRGDAIRGIYLFSTSQWISLLLLIFCILYKRKETQRFKEGRS